MGASPNIKFARQPEREHDHSPQSSTKDGKYLTHLLDSL